MLSKTKQDFQQNVLTVPSIFFTGHFKLFQNFLET